MRQSAIVFILFFGGGRSAFPVTQADWNVVRYDRYTSLYGAYLQGTKNRRIRKDTENKSRYSSEDTVQVRSSWSQSRARKRVHSGKDL